MRRNQGGVMATKTVKVSDLSGNQIPEEESGARLIVEHPDFSEPIGLDVLPNEVLPHLNEQLKRFVVLSYEDPQAQEPQRFILLLEEFNKMFQQEDSASTLQQALQTQQEEREQRPRRRGGRKQDGERKQRIDWASPERAGERHRGIVSEEEQAYVREHLDEVNARLREKGERQIDPNNPRMAARYGFTPPVGSDFPESAESGES
jgi:hypothetical protein